MLLSLFPALVVWNDVVRAAPQSASFDRATEEEPTSWTGSRMDAVREAFRRSWAGYRTYAWGHDSLRPISNGFVDDRNGWGASAIDALSTAIIMGEHDMVDDILAYIPTINFYQTSSDVSLFETTIRYLGGLISAYDLLRGPYQDMASRGAAEPLLWQAVNLADNLKVAFLTETGIPDNVLFFSPEPHTNSSVDNTVATIGTLVLEWQRLSDITGNPEYGDLAGRAESYLLDPKPEWAEPFPGLIGSRVYIANGTFTDSWGGWNGGTDSFYEYLIKMYVYDARRFGRYKDRWVEAVESSMKYLTSHPTTRPDLTFLALYSGTTPMFLGTHLGCFAAGNIIFGGMVLENQAFVDYGLELTHGCHETYAQTSTGIGPEVFMWQDNQTPLDAPNNPGPPDDQVEFYERAGFWIIAGYYALRPEVIESYYHAYRATGNKMYQDWAWQAFVQINSSCSIGSGLAALANVNQIDENRGYFDYQESFWFSEVLKYMYLILVEEDDLDVHVKGAKNKFVYNTEAHPFRVFGS